VFVKDEAEIARRVGGGKRQFSVFPSLYFTPSGETPIPHLTTLIVLVHATFYSWRRPCLSARVVLLLSVDELKIF